MRCDVHTSRSTTKDGKCQRIFCVEEGDPGCGIVLHRKGLLKRFKNLHAERLELEKELVA